MTYQLLLTTLGQQKIASAANAGSLPVTISEFAVGQGINVDFSQRLDQQVLVSKRYQGAVQGVVKTAIAGQYEITCVVPQSEGGWTIREFALIDADGSLIWVGQVPEVQKPAANSTAALDYLIKVLVTIDNPQVNLVIDGSAIMASRAWAIDNFTPITHLTDADPHKQYAFRSNTESDIEELTSKVNELLSREGIKVGDIYTTTIDHVDADAVATHHGYGIWERYAEGRTLVGLSTDASDPEDYRAIGNEFGANEHQLTVAEGPKHVHKLVLKNVSGGVVDVGATDTLKFVNDKTVTSNTNGGPYEQGETVEAGSGNAHNNIQPSKVVAYWLRTD